MNQRWRERLSSLLGACGCISCYVAMFPAILLGVVGVFGLSGARTLGALNAYMNSILFQPILLASILLLVLGLLRFGKGPLTLSVISGLGIFTSMNFYMREWLFTLSFALLALAYVLAYRKTPLPSLKFAFVLLMGVVVLGAADQVRVFLSKPPLSTQTLPPPSDTHTSDMMNMP